jgi:uncharacterized LabA/DUF88 family protein
MPRPNHLYGGFLFIINSIIMETQKVIVYVDGFNFYYGLKSASQKEKAWKKYYWLDIVSFFEKMMTPNQELVQVIYFSARQHNNEASNRQDTFFSANKLNKKFKLILGKYLKKDIICKHCGKAIHSFEEKETDVRLATQIINDVYKENCDISIIVSADSDMIPAIELIRDIKPGHKLFVHFPPLRYSVDLSNCCDGERKLYHFKSKFHQSMLSDEVTLPNGTILRRPSNWV